MNDIMDRLVIRVILSIFMCLIFVSFKYFHIFINSSGSIQLTKKFYPTKNAASTLHFLARILGVGILLSSYQFDISNGLMMALIDFLVQAFLGTLFFIASIYIIESITLANFEYSEEITKKKNLSYALISFSIVISMAIIFKSVLRISQGSAIILFFLSLFCIVIVGLAAKVFPLLTKIPFNLLLIQKNLGPACSFVGYILGTSCIMIGAIGQGMTHIHDYSIRVFLKILLASIIFPIFRIGLIYIFKFQEIKSIKATFRPGVTFDPQNSEEENLGQGIYEGVIFLTASYLTSVITGQINFGINYPIF